MRISPSKDTDKNKSKIATLYSTFSLINFTNNSNLGLFNRPLHNTLRVKEFSSLLLRIYLAKIPKKAFIKNVLNKFNIFISKTRKEEVFFTFLTAIKNRENNL